MFVNRMLCAKWKIWYVQKKKKLLINSAKELRKMHLTNQLETSSWFLENNYTTTHRIKAA